MKTKFALALICISIFEGCATHTKMRGTVAMKVGPHEAHVCLGDNEVKIGDKLLAFKNNCSYAPNNLLGKSEKSGLRTTCKKEIVGKGEVIGLINEHYSLVKFDDSVIFNEGTVVEKE